MKKVVIFILFLIVTALALSFHIGWWWLLVPTLTEDEADPVQGVWFGYLLFSILTVSMPYGFYQWLRTGKFKMP